MHRRLGRSEPDAHCRSQSRTTPLDTTGSLTKIESCPRWENFSSSSVSQLLFSESFSGPASAQDFWANFPATFASSAELGFLFPNRHLHRYQHRAEFDLLFFSQVGAIDLNRPCCILLETVDSRRKRLLENHVARLLRCRRCPRVIPPPVSGGAIGSDVMIIGQAPGVREPTLKRPFAHTAGKTLFRWFKEFCGLDEATMRARIYFAAVIRCFPGKAPGGSDRMPATDEIRNCSGWMNV